MKVLKAPDGAAGWSATFTCPQPRGCGAQLEVTEADLSVGCAEGYDFLGDANGQERPGFKCAVCGTWSSAQVPDGIARRVFAKRAANRDSA